MIARAALDNVRGEQMKDIAWMVLFFVFGYLWYALTHREHK